jgi:hypothetical protein
VPEVQASGDQNSEDTSKMLRLDVGTLALSSALVAVAAVLIREWGA